MATFEQLSNLTSLSHFQKSLYIILQDKKKGELR